ncbi:hypothetical protein SAMN06264867_101136 [Halorubrum cibi]|uniref:Uncharacterized protein n=2 Tax=Halorubrum cibi TaxID=413815 RepID=A0A521AGK7_9EURY|nr:hypothetical protein SAMN06264867_101136 [Halorubrum cibi]
MIDGESSTPDALDGGGGDPGIGVVDDAELSVEFTDDLWLDGVARKIGFGWLSERLPGEIRPSYLYAVVMILTVEVSLQGRTYLTTGTAHVLENPFFLLQPIGLLYAVYGSHALRQRYHQVMWEMDVSERASDPERLIQIVPNWLPWGLFLVTVAVTYIRVLSLGGPVAVYRDYGLSGFLGFTVANPIWLSIAAQFLAVYVSVVLLAPWRLWRSDVGIHFLDPERLGGLRPLGELIKHAYYYLAAGLIALALVIYEPILSDPTVEITAATNLFFTLAWVGTIATIAFGVFILHRFMHREKRRELHRLEQARRQHTEDPWDVATYSVPRDNRDIIDDIQHRMSLVSETREYPATFSIWSQLLLSIVLPKAIQMFIANI